MKLILRADVDDELLALLNELKAEVLVLDTDGKQRRIVGDSQRTEGELDVALSLPGRRNR